MWLDLAIAMSCGGGGLVCGWIMHAIGGFGNHHLVRQTPSTGSQAPTEEVPDQPTQLRVSDVAERLRAYAASMAADVDAHQSKVQAVNNFLVEENDASPEAIVAAVSQLIEANQVMQSQLHRAQDRIHEQSMQIESAERRAQTDPLTRIPNRGAFDQHVQNRHALGSAKAGSLALLDVDHFKKFNDVYGHRAGDEVLRVVAGMLHARLGPVGLVSRYGGEEFAVVLDGYSAERASVLVEQARAAIAEREIVFEDKRLRVTASAGVAQLLPEESIEDWLQRADEGLYKSKEVGRDCGHWMDERLPVRIATIGDDDLKQLEAVQARSTSSGNVNSPESTSSADPSAFAYLPDRTTLGNAYSEIRSRTDSTVSVFLMAVRCHSEVNNASMRSLLQIVRATMRSVDRIGCEDDSTLLICMPSVDEATANDRADQILQSSEALGLSASGEQDSQVGIGLVEAMPDEDFDQLVSRATGAVTCTRLAVESSG